LADIGKVAVDATVAVDAGGDSLDGSSEAVDAGADEGAATDEGQIPVDVDDSGSDASDDSVSHSGEGDAGEDDVQGVGADAEESVFVCTTDQSCLDAGFEVQACQEAVCRSGLCVPEEVVCEDGVFCTLDSCDVETGECAFLSEILEGEPCEDGNICTENDSCVQGECKAGTAKNCDDGEVCTFDECFWVTGMCTHDGGPVAGAICDDGNLCTDLDRCGAGECQGDPKCTDDNPCTEESCDSGTGSCGGSILLDDISCSDGDPCTHSDQCVAGTCEAGLEIECNDDDTCTDDVCDPFTGECVHLVAAHIGEACNDGSECTVNDTCTSIGCIGTSAPNLGQECVVGEGCMNPNVIQSLPFTYVGDTTGFLNDFDSGGCPGSSSSKGSGSPDMIFSYVAASTAEYKFELLKPQGGLDTVLYLTSGCPGVSGTICHQQDDNYGAGGEEIKEVFEMGETVYVVVDGYGLFSSQEGVFSLKITKVKDVETVCGDGIDNDYDGKLDCADEDCDAVLECAPQGDLCGDPLVLSLNQSVSLSTEDFHNLYSRGDCDGGSGGTAAPDVVHSFTATKLGEYTFKIVGADTSFDSILFVNTDCDPTKAGCVGVSENATGSDETVAHTMAAGETVYVFVDGYYGSSDGVFGLEVSGAFKEDQCMDGLDDDDDELIDCDDPDCAEFYMCSAPGDSCETATSLEGAFPIVIEANTAAENVFAKYSGDSCMGDWGADAAAELVYSFVAPISDRYRVHLPFDGTDFDARLYLADSCPATTETCLAGEDLDSHGGEGIQLELEAGSLIYIWVDGAITSTNQGAFKLVVDRVETECSDEADDDGDLLVDCDDPDCSAEVECAAQGDRCEFPWVLSEDDVFEGSNVGANDVYNKGDCEEGDAGKAAGDVAHYFEAEEAGKYTFVLSAGTQSFDSMLWVSSVCPPEPDMCYGVIDEPVNASGPSAEEEMDVLLNAGESVYVFVDGSSPGAQGDYKLSISHVLAETECDNGEDDDSDGLADCLDADCAFSLICAGAAEDCDTALALGNALPLTVSGSTVGYESDYEPKECKGSTGGDAPELVYSFTADADGTYVFELTKTGTDFDTVLYVAGTCPPTVDTCINKKDGVGNGGETIEVDMVAGEMIYIFVDGYKSYSGLYELVVSQD